MAREAELLAEFPVHLVAGLRRVGQQVPFVDHEDDALAAGEDLPHQTLILLRRQFPSVHYEYGHVALIDRVHGPHRRIKFDVVFDPAFAAQTGRIDNAEAFALILEHGVDRIAGRSRDVADQRPLAARQRVKDARLPHVGAADERHADHAFLRALLVFFIAQHLHYLVQKLVNPAIMKRADTDDFLETERVGFGDVVLMTEVVYFIDREDDHRRMRTEHLRHILVHPGDALTAVDHEDHDVALLDGLEYLILHALHDRVFVFQQQTAGIDHVKTFILPLHAAVQTVARNARHIVDDSPAFADDSVEQRRLPYVGTSDDRYYCHCITPSCKRNFRQSEQTSTLGKPRRELRMVKYFSRQRRNGAIRAVKTVSAAPAASDCMVVKPASSSPKTKSSFSFQSFGSSILAMCE